MLEGIADGTSTRRRRNRSHLFTTSSVRCAQHDTTRPSAPSTRTRSVPKFRTNPRRDHRYARRRSSATHASTSSTLTTRHSPSTPKHSTTPRGPRTWRVSSPSTHAPTDFYDDWNGIADDAVAILLVEAGRRPLRPRRLTDLIGELSTRSEEFRVRWADHNVKLHNTGAKTFHHPIVGELNPRVRSVRRCRRPEPDDGRLHADAGLRLPRGVPTPR